MADKKMLISAGSTLLALILFIAAIIANSGSAALLSAALFIAAEII